MATPRLTFGAGIELDGVRLDGRELSDFSDGELARLCARFMFQHAEEGEGGLRICRDSLPRVFKELWPYSKALNPVRKQNVGRVLRANGFRAVGRGDQPFVGYAVPEEMPVTWEGIDDREEVRSLKHIGAYARPKKAATPKATATPAKLRKGEAISGQLFALIKSRPGLHARDYAEMLHADRGEVVDGGRVLRDKGLTRYEGATKATTWWLTTEGEAHEAPKLAVVPDDLPPPEPEVPPIPEPEVPEPTLPDPLPVPEPEAPPTDLATSALRMQPIAMAILVGEDLMIVGNKVFRILKEELG